MKDSTYAKALGSRLLMTVYKGIAPGEDRKALPSLDINRKRLADGVLQLAFSLSQQVSVALHFRLDWIKSDGSETVPVVIFYLPPLLYVVRHRVSSWWICC